jgi:hypothetical protein
VTAQGALVPDSIDDATRARSLAPAIERADPARAAYLLDPATQIVRVPTPYFRHVSVYRVLFVPIVAPVMFTLGHADDWATVFLDSNPDGWMQLAESGVDLSTPALRLAYAVGFLESTRSFAARFFVVRNPEEIGSFENLTPTQHADLTRARARVSEPLFSVSEMAPWLVRAYVVEDFSLFRVHLAVDERGVIERTNELLQEDLPLPLAL